MNSDIHFIKDDKGNVYNYDHLIWAADLKTLYEIVDINGVDTKLKSEFKETKNNILNNRGGDSVFTLFVEVNEPLESFKKVSNGHFFYTPSKQGLGKVHTDDLYSLLENWNNIDKDQILTWLEKFIQLNTFEISIPGLKDPNLVPTGKTGIIISFLAEYDLFKKTQLSGWYDEFIAEIEKRLLKLMSDTIYPMLKDKVIGSFAFTPISIENRVGSSEGAITGWSFERPVPVVNKIQFSDRSVLTPIPFVYQAGQWAYSPAGVPMSILTGKLAADKIIKKNKSG